MPLAISRWSWMDSCQSAGKDTAVQGKGPLGEALKEPPALCPGLCLENQQPQVWGALAASPAHQVCPTGRLFPCNRHWPDHQALTSCHTQRGSCFLAHAGCIWTGKSQGNTAGFFTPFWLPQTLCVPWEQMRPEQGNEVAAAI